MSVIGSGGIEQNLAESELAAAPPGSSEPAGKSGSVRSVRRWTSPQPHHDGSRVRRSWPPP
jgi:hypothetical protein